MKSFKEIKMWKNSLTEEDLDYLDELETIWNKRKGYTLYEDMKTFKDSMFDIATDKILELSEQDTHLTRVLDEVVYIRRNKFLRAYNGADRQLAWEQEYKVTDIKLKHLLADVRSQLDRFRQIHKTYNKETKKNHKMIDLEEIKTIPIEKIYSGELKRTGGKLRGLCPFHSERTPSFFIYENTNTFYCFSCNSGGNVIDFYCKLYNMDFKESINNLSNYL